ncbi:MAG: DMT family transporter, partial [Oscillospiraceae bacterium]
MKTKKAHLADMTLLLVAMCWGATFPMFKECINAGMSGVLVNAFKFTIAAVAIGIIFCREIPKITKKEFLIGAKVGLLLVAADLCQGIGQEITSPANSAVITSFYVVLIPVFWWLLGKRGQGKRLLLASILCVLGVVILNYSQDSAVSLNFGDALVFCCAVLTACQIITVGIAAGNISPKKIAVVQMSVCAAFSWAASLVGGQFNLSAIEFSPKIVFDLLYLGLIGTCFGFGVQLFAQKHTSPTNAGICMSLEGLFGALFSVFFKMQALSAQLILGTALTVAGVIIAELSGSGSA